MVLIRACSAAKTEKRYLDCSTMLLLRSCRRMFWRAPMVAVMTLQVSFKTHSFTIVKKGEAMSRSRSTLTRRADKKVASAEPPKILKCSLARLKVILWSCQSRQRSLKKMGHLRTMWSCSWSQRRMRSFSRLLVTRPKKLKKFQRRPCSRP